MTNYQKQNYNSIYLYVTYLGILIFYSTAFFLHCATALFLSQNTSRSTTTNIEPRFKDRVIINLVMEILYSGSLSLLKYFTDHKHQAHIQGYGRYSLSAGNLEDLNWLQLLVLVVLSLCPTLNRVIPYIYNCYCLPRVQESFNSWHFQLLFTGKTSI